jgi:hypothetical protein
MNYAVQDKTDPSLSRYLIFFIFILPLSCACLVVVLTFFEAREGRRVWRNEFHYALEQQCPAQVQDIRAGAGSLYLDGYRDDYSWQGGGISCHSDGRIIRCSCRADQEQYSAVTKFMNQEGD